MVRVVDGYPDEELVNPTVAVDSRTIKPVNLQLGSAYDHIYRLWVLDVYALNKSQRDDITYRLMHSLTEANIPVYNYDEGFPPAVTPSQIGVLEVDSINIEIIQVMPQLVNQMYYRSVITFTADYLRNGG